MTSVLFGVALLAARIAIVSSSSNAAGQPDLRYAERDGDRLAEVLNEVGSVESFDIWRLREATVPALRAALDRAEARAAREPGSVVVVYFSGHADPTGLLLGGERFPYHELRERLSRSKAQVRVAILDGCNAGGATRPKGGRPSPGPALPAVVPLQVDGAAILAATGSEELAQESSDIEGSYFTHHLVSGLRGAGDRDGNGVVTLGEAYAYAYSRTVAATVPSLWGPQHPSYDYRLSGTGDLVLTSLGRSRQALLFPAAGDGGVYTILDDKREVVAELRPNARAPLRLALGPGRYRVVQRKAGRIAAAEISLRSGMDTAVQPTDLQTVTAEDAASKGGRPAARDALFLEYGLAGRNPGASPVSSEYGLAARRDIGAWSVGARLAYGETSLDDIRVSYRLRRFTAGAYLLRPWRLGPVDLRWGGGVAVTRALQTLSNSAELAATVPWAGAALALEVPLFSALAVRLAWDVGGELVPVDGSERLRFAVRALLGVGLRR